MSNYTVTNKVIKDWFNRLYIKHGVALALKDGLVALLRNSNFRHLRCAEMSYFPFLAESFLVLKLDRFSLMYIAAKCTLDLACTSTSFQR